MSRKMTNEKFLERLKEKNIPYIPLEEYIDMHTKIKWMCCNNIKHIFEASPTEIIHRSSGCPYCSHQKVFVGETDLWTTHPEIAKMLDDSNDGYRFSFGSGKKVDWKCPCCGYIVKNKSIEKVVKRGLSCPICSDGISYPEKFVANIFNQLKIDFESHKIFEWSDGKIYDFYIPSLNLIVETHGIQHYVECNFSGNNQNRSLIDEQQNDKYKQKLAYSNGILDYVVIDCRQSEKNFIKMSILNSKMSNIFNLSSIDWDVCDNKAHKSYYNDILYYYNNGITNSIDIANLIGINRKTVITALHKMAKNNICDYDSKTSSAFHISKAHYKKVICVETKKIYESIKSTKEDGFSPKCVSGCCNGSGAKTHKGYHWMYYEDYLKQKSEDNYGEAV